MNEPEPMELPEPMDEFERALTRALRRVDVRAETAAKFLAVAAPAHEEHRRTGRYGIKPASGGRILMFPKATRAWIGGAIAALLVLGVFGVEQAHVRQQRECATLAQQQFETATRITDHTLDQVRAQLAQAGVLQYE